MPLQQEIIRSGSPWLHHMLPCDRAHHVLNCPPGTWQGHQVHTMEAPSTSTGSPSLFWRASSRIMPSALDHEEAPKTPSPYFSKPQTPADFTNLPLTHFGNTTYWRAAKRTAWRNVPLTNGRAIRSKPPSAATGSSKSM